MKTFKLAKGAAMLGAALFASSAAGACLSLESESNNSERRANAGACSGVGIGGTIASNKDEDWYRLDLAAAGEIAISLAHDSGIDLDWYLVKAGALKLPVSGLFSVER